MKLSGSLSTRSIRVVAAAVAVVIGVGTLTSCEAVTPKVTITYEIAFKGSPAANHQQFADHVAKTLADGRGWTMHGQIKYRKVSSGAQMVVWLVREDHMADFGPPCMYLWSCRSGKNVAINDTRWRTATPTWSLGLDNYQHYVVEHEVGHWMGQSHASCGGAGQAAPVMMQQSKGVAPCKNQVWPLLWERQQVAARWGVKTG